ncbi:hypothetical protein BgiMline_024299 [Biomphalaria glabrata]|nr:hypothetical protein BgiMline_007499 [Biomphalaria glabrata]
MSYYKHQDDLALTAPESQMNPFKSKHQCHCSSKDRDLYLQLRHNRLNQKDGCVTELSNLQHCIIFKCAQGDGLDVSLFSKICLCF